MEDFIIPINLAIKGFYNHLFANQRTILSSKFGMVSLISWRASKIQIS